MMVYAYLRVSSNVQDEENQLLGIKHKAEELNLVINKFVVDKISGVKEPDERNLGKLMRKLQEGDIILISELSRFGRRLFMLFRILEQLMNKGVKVYSVKDGYNLDNTMQSKVLAFAFGLAAEIERDMISKRTKEALTVKKEQGVKLGRPIGSKSSEYKLNQYKDKIIKWRAKGWSKAKISRKCHCTWNTVSKFLKIWGIE